MSNPQRCAEAVYRHVERDGGLEVPGLNRPLEDQQDDDASPFGTEYSDLADIAHRWAMLDPSAALPARTVQHVRDLTSLDTVLAALAASVSGPRNRRDRLARAYARIAAIQIETIRLREANGMSGLSLATVSSALGLAIATQAMPAAASALLEELLHPGRPAASDSAADVDLERLVQRIQGLRAKTVEQGCTEQACQGVGIDTGRRRLGPIDDCVPAIAAFFDCRAWSEKAASSPIRHIFFGLRADVEAAHYLYDLIGVAFATETASFARGSFYRELGSGERRSATNSFQIGLGRGIVGKLDSLRQERDAALLASSGRDLVPIKTSVVDDELAKLGLHFRARSRGSKRSLMTDAYEAGEAAGKRFEYRRGLAASS